MVEPHKEESQQGATKGNEAWNEPEAVQDVRPMALDRAQSYAYHLIPF